MQSIVGLLLSLGIFVVSAAPTWDNDQAMAIAAGMFAEGADRAQDGVSVKEKFSKKYDVFGVPVGGEFGYKMGAGDSLNRDKRQAEDDEVEIEVEVEDDSPTFEVEYEIPEDGSGNDKKWYKRLKEVCKRFIRQVAEYFKGSGTTNQ
ncbi:uncharacterized protein LOC129804704 isoform X2 [Phlebotomus papatasi]|uniref:uncharacterized protein LOC129804704 isoform X2 n=1 Tax=Phlebotomus papatasi TaxID=29031 RepID=UPI00248428DD|nr:uncharacterized protein LOC129804704 isoform X2 [Phlebotomus papatasi]